MFLRFSFDFDMNTTYVVGKNEFVFIENVLVSKYNWLRIFSALT